MTKARISIIDALRGSVDLWRRALPVAWAPLLGVALFSFLSTPALGLSPLWSLMSILLSIPASVVAYGALLRLALADRHPGEADYRLGPAGLQWNVIETRLLGSVLLLALFFLLAALGAVFVVMLTTIVVAAATGSTPKPGDVFFATPSGMAAGVVILVAVGAIFWSAARLTLTTPATVDRRQIQVFSTWDATRGQAWPLILAFVVIGLPGVILNLIAGYLHQTGGDATPIIALLAYGFAALVFGLVQTPLVVGVSAYVYRRLQDRDTSAV